MIKIQSIKTRLGVPLLIGTLLFYLFVGCGNLSDKIKVDILSKHINANQPFRLTFSISGNNLLTLKSHNEIPLLNTNDFAIIGGVNTFRESSDYYGKKSSKQIYTFTLLPLKTGDLLINPWTIKTSDKETYTTDTIRIHVYDGKISTKDSLEIVKSFVREVYTPSSYYTDSILKNRTFFNAYTAKKSMGIHSYALHTLYEVNANDSLNIFYSIVFVNVKTANEARLKNLSMDDFKWPEEIAKISERSSVTVNNDSGYTEYNKEFTIKLLAKKRGVYNIYPITFSDNGEKYMAPEVRIIVR